jgi:teichuronic acid biosynthesis glycosyltransferase TuaG
MDSANLISIVMPAYNSESHIQDSIQSIINQSLHNWELIIVDNCSTDGTVDIIKKIQSTHSNIQLYSTDFNSGGPAVPRNIGINNSAGKYLAFIDSDDVWDINKLRVQLPYLKMYNLVCCLANKINEDGLVVNFSKSIRNKEINLCSLVYKNTIINSSVIVHKNLFMHTLFDESQLILGLEDYSSYIRYVGLHGNALLVGEPLVNYRIVTGSLGSSIVGEKRFSVSVLCLVKSLLVIGDYRCLVGGLIIRFRSYIKYKFFSFLGR